MRQSQARGTALEQEIKRKEDHIKRNEAEIKSCRQDIATKGEEVSYFTFVVYHSFDVILYFISPVSPEFVT